MTDLVTLAAVSAAVPTRLNPVELFMQADIVVQLVMAGLILASIWVWMIIVSFSIRIGAVRRRADSFEKDFWGKIDCGSFADLRSSAENACARVAGAALAEWRKSSAGSVKNSDGLRQRLAATMESQVAVEADTLADRLNFLATVGAVAPFVGLFGTVWGIMNSFFQIGMQQNSSLAVVAPGISEALFATAIGLFAAIPAVIAYNRLSHRVNAFEARLQRFADRFHATLSRELDSR